MYDKVEIMKTLMMLSKILDIPFSWKEEPEPKRLRLLDFSIEPEPKRLQAFWWRLHSPETNKQTNKEANNKQTNKDHLLLDKLCKKFKFMLSVGLRQGGYNIFPSTTPRTLSSTIANLNA